MKLAIEISVRELSKMTGIPRTSLVRQITNGKCEFWDTLGHPIKITILESGSYDAKMGHFGTDTPISEKQESTKEERGKENINNININNKKETEQPSTPRPDTKVYPWMEEGWGELLMKWLEYKREKKQTYKSESSIKVCYNRLKKLSGGVLSVAKEMINEAIANNWAGFFELKGKKDSSVGVKITDNENLHKYDGNKDW